METMETKPCALDPQGVEAKLCSWAPVGEGSSLSPRLPFGPGKRKVHGLISWGSEISQGSFFSVYSPPATGPRESGPGGKSEMQMLLGELRVAPAFSLPLSRAVVLEHLSAESARRMMGPWLVSDPGGLQWG